MGAGILGLAVAREALRRFPGIEVAVLEKEANVAWPVGGALLRTTVSVTDAEAACSIGSRAVTRKR